MVVITDLYRKLTLAIPASTITTLQVSNVILNDWIVTYGIQREIKGYNGLQNSKNVCRSLRLISTDQSTTTVCHPLKNFQTEQ